MLYIDEGISGTSVKNRTNFLKMIKDAKYGYFDLILTKEISKFFRNTVDSIKYTQELLENDVGVSKHPTFILDVLKICLHSLKNDFKISLSIEPLVSNNISVLDSKISSK